jgi:hypothetical protein
MLESATAHRPSVLLLAGEVREEWTRALEAGGLDVAATGWLDGITAARLRRPDLLLVSTDLPEGAPWILLSTFRSAVDFVNLPIVIAGRGADRYAGEELFQYRADHYVADPVDGEAIRKAIGIGRVPAPRHPHARKIAVLGGVAMISLFAALGIRVFGEATGAGPFPGIEWLFFCMMLVTLSAFAAFAIYLKPGKRPTARLLRSSLGWIGLMLVNLRALVPGDGQRGRFGLAALGLLACAAWAWMGPRVKERSRGEARAFHFLAAALALLSAALVVLAIRSVASRS